MKPGVPRIFQLGKPVKLISRSDIPGEYFLSYSPEESSWVIFDDTPESMMMVHEQAITIDLTLDDEKYIAMQIDRGSESHLTQIINIMLSGNQ